jgi:hypothetical protein
MFFWVFVVFGLLFIAGLRNLAAVTNPVFPDVAFAVYLAAFIAGNHEGDSPLR